MRDTASATPRYRPYLSCWQFIDATIQQFFRLARLYLEALCDDSPEHAATLGERAQAEINAAAAAARAYCDRADRWNRVGLAAVEDPRLGPLIGIALAASGDVTSEADIERKVLNACAQITGEADAARDAVTIASVRLQLIQVESICNESRVVDIARQTYQVLSAHADRLRALVQSPDWLCAYKKMNQELVEIGTETRRLLPDFKRPLSAARATIRLGHVLTERCAKPLASTLLAVQTGKPFARLLQKDVGALLDQLRQGGLSDLLFGLDKALRHADAHAEFEVREDGVLFTSSAREYDALTWGELFDRVIGGLESVLAINLGLTIAAFRVGVIVDPLELLDFTIEERLRIALSLAGMETETLQVSEGLLRAELRSSQEPRLALLAMLLPYLPQDVTRANLAVTIGDRGEFWEAEMDPLRRWSVEQDPARKTMLFCEAMTRIRRNQAPAVSRDALRQVAAAAVGQAIGATEGWRTASTSVQSWCILARRAGDPDLAACLACIWEGLTDLAAGTRPGEPFAAAVDQLQSWVHL
ncbi:MAG: hypothetical protein JNN08_01980 [Bryobacterales bacterium]|nr:hypothetical protein [Bryobacterales bacterium]